MLTDQQNPDNQLDDFGARARARAAAYPIALEAPS